MLKLRIITAMILAAGILAAIAWLPLDALAVLLWLVAAAGAYEWAGLASLTKPSQRLIYVAVFAVLAYLLYPQAQWHPALLWFGCGVWLLAGCAVVAFPRGEDLFRQGWFTALVGLAVLVPAWLALVTIRAFNDGQFWLIWILFIAWAADIGAYFAGRAFGRRKLAPAVSPGKTWEGVFGGFLFAAVICGLGVFYLSQQWLIWLPVIALLVAVSVFGDLFESVLKRSTGVKDSGALLPGHGGVLDRIDSLLAVLPVFAVLLGLIG